MFRNLPLQTVPTALQAVNRSTAAAQSALDDVHTAFVYISLFVSFANLLLVVLEIYTHGIILLLKFTLSLPIWSHLIASVSSFVYAVWFLSGGARVDDSHWIAAAIGVLAALVLCWF